MEWRADVNVEMAHATLETRRRLEIVERVMSSVLVRGRKFYMGLWFEDPEDQMSCDTAACAAGWLARDQEARSLGLQVYAGGPMVAMAVPERWRSRWLGYEAMRAFAHLPGVRSARWLFDPDAYVRGESATAADVLDRVRWMLSLCPSPPSA